VYFRHGAKSEPATSDDLRQFMDRRVEQTRRLWEKRIRKVMAAPAGYKVQVVAPNVKLVPSTDAQEVRLVNDASAPAAQFVNPDGTHPFRQKELIPEIIRRSDGKVRPTSHQIQCVRRIHKTDTDPNFTYSPRFGSRQYSALFAGWIVERVLADPEFLKNACEEHTRNRTKTKVNKPR
jgi:hypothetical protein